MAKKAILEYVGDRTESLYVGEAFFYITLLSIKDDKAKIELFKNGNPFSLHNEKTDELSDIAELEVGQSVDIVNLDLKTIVRTIKLIGIKGDPAPINTKVYDHITKLFTMFLETEVITKNCSKLDIEYVYSKCVLDVEDEKIKELTPRYINTIALETMMDAYDAYIISCEWADLKGALIKNLEDKKVNTKNIDFTSLDSIKSVNEIIGIVNKQLEKNNEKFCIVTVGDTYGTDQFYNIIVDSTNALEYQHYFEQLFT
ncbi:MAG: hypothetical protein WCK31_02800 [bacterium]